MRVAHAEKRDWRSELNKFLLAYGSTPHLTTGKSPAELLYGRKMTTKLPEVADLEESEGLGHQQARDHDAAKKQVVAYHVNKRYQAAEKCIQEGDLVLLERKKENKLSPHYEKEPYQVTSCYGDQVQLKSPQGVEYKGNVQHVKCFVTPVIEPEEPSLADPVLIPHERTSGRSGRVTRPPERLSDYLTT